MKNMKFTFALTVLTVFMAGMAMVSTASAALPQKHEEYLKDEGYKDAFEQFMLGMEEAKERFTADDYKTLEKDNNEAIAEYFKEAMVGSATEAEAEAYADAYYVAYELTSREQIGRAHV
jgi:hypothetical protein